MIVGSLFSGIGGLDLGFERAGYAVSWQCEKNVFCRKILSKHWPSIPCFEDVNGFPWGRKIKADILLGGFPCQDISTAGKVAGIHGEKSSLWFNMLKIISLLEPRYAVVENVPSIRTNGLREILWGLAKIGYNAEWTMLPAATFGAPHIRKRLCLVAYPDNKREPVLPINGKEWERLSKSHHREAWMLSEPSLGGMDDGLPGRVDRIKALGNAVVPAWAEWIALKIKQAEEGS